MNLLISSAFDLQSSNDKDTELRAIGLMYFSVGQMLEELGDKFVPNPKPKLNLNYWVNTHNINIAIAELLQLQNEWIFNDKTFKTVKACALLQSLCISLHNLVLISKVSVDDVLKSTLHWLEEERGLTVNPVSQIAKLRKKFLNTIKLDGLPMQLDSKTIPNLTKRTK